ncbi:bacteriohemerythrin [Holophaga foetida]|uniref:bacteriohemerythrin n=1 Tax=Holophaga foetida TaxID=35839 RepID=UPI0002474D03|nr:bacteriohemerythrin [Holophaga foetida]
MPWSADRLVGIQRFDEQHERLASLITHLHSTMILRRDKPLSLQLFARLILETKRHFAAEMDLMEAFGYPDLEAHAREHAQLILEAEELARQYEEGHISALALPSFLKKWLITHIEESDRAYVDFFKVLGIT